MWKFKFDAPVGSRVFSEGFTNVTFSLKTTAT